MEQNQPKLTPSVVTKKWYQKDISVILLLFLFSPVGIYLMWKNSNWSKTIKWVVTIIFSFIFISALTNPSKTTKQAEVQPKTSVAVETKNEPTVPAETQQTKTWQKVFEMSGNANKSSDTFALTSGKVKVSYTFNAENTNVNMVIGSIYIMEEGKIYDKDGGLPVTTVTNAGSDSTIARKTPGNYYLHVLAANTNYTILIEEEK